MYLTQTDPGAGGVSLLVGITWFFILLTGILILRGSMPSNPVRASFRRRLALGALIVGGLGIVQLIIRWLETLITPGTDDIPYVDWRLWSYLILVTGTVFFGYMFWYFRTRYRKDVVATRHVRIVKPAQRRQQAVPKAGNTNGTTVSEPKPDATTSRRESRRERKRRKR